MKFALIIRKAILNLETKLLRLETADDKLINAINNSEQVTDKEMHMAEGTQV